jgi:hypothetical protein
MNPIDIKEAAAIVYMAKIKSKSPQIYELLVKNNVKPEVIRTHYGGIDVYVSFEELRFQEKTTEGLIADQYKHLTQQQ